MKNFPRIKVCGMRDPENISRLAMLPIDYMGFIFYPASPRYVEKKLDFSVLTLLEHRGIAKAGVFVNDPPDKVINIAHENRLEVIQCHGEETPEYCARLRQEGFRVIKAFRVNEKMDKEWLERYKESCDYFLFDTFSPSYGGSGKKFDWTLLKMLKSEKPFLLSGGIGPGDEKEIARVVLSEDLLYAVDLNSRFEVSPGVKDVGKIDSFIRTLHSLLKSKENK